MNSGRFILTQILDLIHWQTLSRLVSKYNAESKVRHFGVRQQLICMAFAQLTWRNGLRDIEVPKCETRRTLSSGLSGTSSQIDLGRCQRDPRLETLGGFDKKPDQPSTKALSRRDIGVGLGQYDLRSGFFNNRSHDVGVSLGKVSHNKKRDQTSHAIGFKGPNSHLHLHFRRKTQRCELLGRVDFRTRSHIHHGQRICRLGEALSDCKLWGVFCHSGQGQSAFYQIQVPPCRQSHGIAKRPDRETHDSQIKERFHHTFKGGLKNSKTFSIM